MAEKMFFVYIIRSLKDKKFYTGFTSNIERRLEEHNKGTLGTESTLGRGPFELIHVEIVKNRNKARELEKYYKSGTGREIRDEIVKLWWV
jgi:putative endonuclease